MSFFLIVATAEYETELEKEKEYLEEQLLELEESNLTFSAKLEKAEEGRLQYKKENSVLENQVEKLED